MSLRSATPRASRKPRGQRVMELQRALGTTCARIAELASGVRSTSTQAAVIQTGSVATLLTTHPIAAIGVVFAGGILTSLTPCIYPMIPITAAIVGGQSANRATSFARTAALTFAYVLGLALAYASLGLLAGLTGQLFG